MVRADEPGYLSEELTSANFVLSAVPMPLTAVTITMLMPAAMMAIFDGGSTAFIVDKSCQ